MKKLDNTWYIEEEEGFEEGFQPKVCSVTINGTKYFAGEDMCALIHSVLLLVDAVNDKEVADE